MRAIFFDLGQTLIDYHGTATAWLEMERRGFLAVHARLGAGPAVPEWPRFQAAMEAAIAGCWEEATTGRHNPTVRTIVERAFVALDLPADEAFLAACAGEYCAPISREAAPIDGARETLAALHAAGFRLGLISNTFWPAEHHVADLERFGLLAYLDALVFSSEVGVWKPDPRVFDHALSALGAGPDETAFVGDRLVDDVAGAQRAGLRAVLREHDGEDNDYARGRALGIVPDAAVRDLRELPAVVARWRKRPH